MSFYDRSHSTSTGERATPGYAMPTLVGILVVIGLVIGLLGWRTISYTPAVSDLIAADPAVGYDFYAGIDQALTSGSTDALEQLLAPGFVDHNGDTSRSGDELIEQLVALHTTFPGVHIQVKNIEAAAGSLVTSIALVEVAGATVAGLPLSLQPVQAGYEILRIHNGKVIERWSSGLPDVSATSFDDATFTLDMNMNTSIRLDLIELPADSSFQWGDQGHSIVMVESGTARVSMNWIGKGFGPQTSLVLLSAGDAVKAPSGSGIRIEADGDEPVRLLRFSTRWVSAVDPPAATLTGGATSTLLWGSNLAVSGKGPWTVSFGLLRLTPETVGQIGIDTGGALLTCGEGALDLIAPGGVISELDANCWPASVGDNTTTDADEAAVISGPTSVQVRSESNKPIWLIGIVPEDGTATPTAHA